MSYNEFSFTYKTKFFDMDDVLSIILDFLVGYELPFVLTCRAVLRTLKLKRTSLITFSKYFCSSVDLINWAIDMNSELAESPNLCRYLSSNGNIDILQWCRSQHPPCPWDAKCCTLAAENGHLETLQWLRSQTPPCTWNESTFAAATKGTSQFNQFLIVKFLHSNHCPWDIEACCNAAARGHIFILQFLRAQSPPCPWNGRTTAIAAKYGHIHVLKWLRSQNPPCPCDESTFSTAVINGRLHVVDYILNAVPRYPRNLSTMIQLAAQNGHLHILEYALKYYSTCVIDENVLRATASAGHLPVLQWIHRHYRGNPSSWNVQALFRNALKYGHIEILNWLMVTFLVSPDMWDNPKNYYALIQDNQLPALKWLCARSKSSNGNWLICEREMCNIAAQYNRLEILKFIYQMNPENISWDVSTICDLAASRGHLEMLQWVVHIVENANVGKGNDCDYDSAAPNYSSQLSYSFSLWSPQSVLQMAARTCHVDVVAWVQPYLHGHLRRGLAPPPSATLTSSTLEVLGDVTDITVTEQDGSDASEVDGESEGDNFNSAVKNVVGEVLDAELPLLDERPAAKHENGNGGRKGDQVMQYGVLEYNSPP
jgi:hypothetical protein